MLPKTGRFLPGVDKGEPGATSFAAAVAAVLRGELGDSHQATKTIMQWTGASERTVRNWLSGTYGPSGEHLVAIAQHSDAVFELFLLLAGRDQALAAKKLLDARDTLVTMLEIVVDLTR